MLKAADALSLI
jgi:hypothetical protein